MEPGRPSETAARIAVQRAVAAGDPFLRRLLSQPDEPYSAWFAEEHAPGSLAEAGRHASRARWMDPGGLTSILTRKRFVEDEVRAALAAEGLEQVVVLGAGYDPLSLLLRPEFPRVRFFELDHPATQAVKRRALEARGALPAELVLVPADFAGDSVESALRMAPGFRADRPSVFLAEGVLPYLEARAVDALLAAVVGLGGKGSRFVFSLADRQALAEPRSAAARMAAQAAHLGEPVRSTHHRPSLPRFLARRGLRVRRLVDAEELWRLYLDPVGAVLRPREGELLVSAEIAGPALPGL